jgi:lipopolysaccharide export system ATP-binding protein
MDLLQTRDLTKVYNRVPVVDRINLEFASGKVTALLGRNGAGKTTTFLMMAGIVKPDHGSVELNGENVNGIPSYERSQKGLIYLPQQHSVFMKATVFDNLYMVLELYGPAAEAGKKGLR